jgi:two-component system, OmpR family, sensor histidine kinase VicK
MSQKTSSVVKQAFLRGGGEMGQLIRDYNWSLSTLGDPDIWPQNLKITLNLLLNSKFPMFLWWGPDFICFYNDAYRPSLGMNGKHPGILGMPGEQAWPEIWDYIKPMIGRIWSGGESEFQEDLLLPIYRNGAMEDVFWTYSYSPVIDENDLIAGVLVICNETTQKVNLLRHLQVSERRFQSLIGEATVGIIVLNGQNCNVEVVNEAYCKLIGRTVPELIGQPLFRIIPDAEEEYLPIIEKVRVTGQPAYLYQHAYSANKNGNKIRGYLDIIYQPYKETHDQVTGVMILCQDVTAQVNARKATETALDQLRLSKDAAQLGMFDMDLEKGTMQWDQRCRTLFGITHSGAVTYEHDFVHGLHPDDRVRITKIIDNLYIRSISNGVYDVEYRTVGAEDGRVRWVRAKGQVYFNSLDKPVRFIGSVLDITPEKVNETRKNDFIAMVSHELKTPLTSLTAYIQLLLGNAQENPSAFDSGLLARANVQTKKMNGLINGFLNLSRLESGKLDLQLKTFSIQELIRIVVDDLIIGREDPNIEFLPCAKTIVRADREKVESVITNLLSNAVKYSPKGSKITVICREDNDDVTISVRDRGIGINAGDMPHIFDRFYRIESQRTKDISGFGIGLYLSAEIVKLHGGRIWAESEYGEGSTFYISIPIAL